MICICGFVILIRIEIDMFYVVIHFLFEMRHFSNDVCHTYILSLQWRRRTRRTKFDRANVVVAFLEMHSVYN